MLKSMNFLSGKSRGKVVGGTKLTPLVPVILGLVPRILFQQGSNIVNKFALLLNKCWLREDSWDKPKNDWCKGRGLSVFCTFFKYPSPAGKPAPSPAGGEGLHRPWCNKILGTRPRMTGGRGAGFVRLLRRYTPRNDVNSAGRSMIEMLGVLAIIGVLSVGGIAGYSKAMEKFKVNKTISEYSMLIFGLSEHEEEIKKLTQKTNLYSLASSLNIIPESWKNGTDNLGNNVAIFYTPRDYSEPRIVIDMYLGGVATNADGSKSAPGFSHQLCFELLQNIAYPLHESLYLLWIYRTGKEQNSTYMGDAYCGGGRKCIKDLTVTEMDRLCKTCDKSNEACSVTLNF